MSSLIIHGAQTSLYVGLVSTMIALGLRTLVGTVSAITSGAIRSLCLRLTELFQIMPGLLFATVLITVFGSHLQYIVFAVGFVSWPPIARITRSQVHRIKTLDYVTASRASGSTEARIALRVILPNALPPVIAHTTSVIGSAIVLESGLAFLGITDPNAVTWGQIIGANRTYVLEAPYMVAIPGAAIFVLVVAVHFIGDGINRQLNPKHVATKL